MKTLLVIFSFLFSVCAVAQPLLYPHEFNLEFYDFKDDFKFKVNSSIVSSHITDSFQMSMIYKLKKDSNGQLGGQAWIKLNSFFWIGVEGSTNLNFSEVGSEIFLATEVSFSDAYKCFFYGSVLLDEEIAELVGLKCYLSSISVGVQTHLNFNDTNVNNPFFKNPLLFVGFRLEMDSVKKILDLFKKED